MALREEKYKYNQAILKDYGGQGFKLIHLNVLRTSGIEEDKPKKRLPGTVNDEKLSVNISRAKQAVLELAQCNDWQYWVTITLDPKKFVRNDLEAFRRNFTQWLRDYSKKVGCKIKYHLVPELHKDGQSWHMHGFLMGLPDEERRPFEPHERLPYYILNKLSQGFDVYDWPAYRERYGWVNMEPVRNRQAAARYITKYITKDLVNTVSDVGAHMYYCSQGLQRSEVIKKGTMLADMVPDYENEYVRVKWFAADTPIEFLKDMIL